jgi:hypothetical protein
MNTREEAQRKLEARNLSTQEMLCVARIYGEDDRCAGMQAQPLQFLCWMTNFVVMDEELCREIVSAYQAGYQQEVN